MDHDRRLRLAALASAQLPALVEAVADRWRALLPGAPAWSAAQHARAHQVVEAVLQGLIAAIAQGDLDERSWRRSRAALDDGASGAPGAVEELLHSIRVVGIEHLLAHLNASDALRAEDRWPLQLQAHTYLEQLEGAEDEVSPDTVAALLAELQADEPDLG